MTIEELNEKYTQASWLIAKQSAKAAGKALMFATESLEETHAAIGAIYGLTDEEIAELAKTPVGEGALSGAQKVAEGLLGTGLALNAKGAIGVARTALENGHGQKMIGTLLRAGPSAAKAVAETGKVASKGTPWGWIATAGYAVGSGSWFAYHARSFNLEVFEFVRVREGLEAISAHFGDDGQALLDEPRTMTLAVTLPTPKAVVSTVGDLTEQAGAVLGGMWERLRRLKS